MPYDGFVMRQFLEYSKPYLLNAHIRNFYIFNKIIYFSFQSFDLKISLNPSYSYITFEKRNLPLNTKSHYFVEYLRSKVRGGVIKNIEQIGLERTYKFEVYKVDDVGNKHNYEIYIDIMGKHSNIIFVENGIILDAYKRIKNRFRNIFPGEQFKIFSSNKINPLDVDQIKKLKTINESDKALELIYKNIQGFSKVTARELLFRAGLGEDEVIKWDDKLEKFLKEIIQEFSEKNMYVYFENNKPFEISAFSLNHLAEKFRKFSKPDEAINLFFSWNEKKSLIYEKKKALEDVLVKYISKLENTLDKINSEIEKNKNYDLYKKYGELLKAYFYQIDEKMNKVVLYDWENDENIEVPLDSNKEPLENANYYFKKYNKMKNKLKGLLERKKVLEDELDYLYQIWYTIEDAESEEEIEEIKFEMQNMGLIKDKKGRSKKVIKSEPRKVEHNGFVIYIGKNNKQNDELVRKANDEDLWFHVHEMPGSHVVLKNNGKDIDEEVIRFAAELAAGYSKGKNSGKVPVDYTKVKYVRKTKGLKPGLVLYSNYKTIYVKPRRIDNV